MYNIYRDLLKINPKFWGFNPSKKLITHFNFAIKGYLLQAFVKICIGN